jgi:replication initiation and membrane attachment protein
MSTSWTALLPSDRYVVHRAESISINHMGYLTHLYQPIIGSSALSLYLTLVQEIPSDQIGMSKAGTHRWLLSAARLPMDLWLEARQALEGVGLLRVFKYNDLSKDETIFEYHIIAPLNPVLFFQSDILSTLLLNRIGKFKYCELRDRYISPLNHEYEDVIRDHEVTKGFDEVYRLLSPSELTIKKGSEQEKVWLESERLTEKQQIGQQVSKLQLRNKIDVSLVRSLISPVFKPYLTVTADKESDLSELAFLYHLTEKELAYFIENPNVYDEEGKLDWAELTSTIKEWYKKNHYGILPDATLSSNERKDELVQKPSPHKERPTEPVDESHGNAVLSTIEQHVRRLETMSPLDRLSDLHQGGKIPNADIHLVESLINEYKLPLPVVNVLLEYVLLTQQDQLPRPLVEKIAGHWKRLKLTNAQEALEIAKKMHKQWSGKEKGLTTQTKGRATSNRKDKLPEAVQKQLESEKHKSVVQTPDGNRQDPEYSEKERRALELLRALGELK